MIVNSKLFHKFEKFFYIVFNPYVLKILNGFSKDTNTTKLDLVFVIPDGKAWILKGICEEISKRLAEKIKFKIVTLSSPLPKANTYFFSHFLLYCRSYFSSSHVRNFSKNFIWYTHFEKGNKIRFKDLISFLKYSHGLIFQNSSDLNFLSEYIEDKNKFFLNIGAVDIKLFQPINRLKNKFIGFSSNFYDRKNPDLIFEIIKSNPNREFKIIGSGWDKYEKFHELQSLKNLKIIKTNYINYPSEYQTLRIFISVSKLEGGPLPTLEAMSCNVFPIVTNTGFNKEVIDHGKNGFLIDIDAKVSEISELINLAWDFDENVSKSVNRYDWDNFSKNIINYMKL